MGVLQRAGWAKTWPLMRINSVASSTSSRRPPHVERQLATGRWPRKQIELWDADHVIGMEVRDEYLHAVTRPSGTASLTGSRPSNIGFRDASEAENSSR